MLDRMKQDQNAVTIVMLILMPSILLIASTATAHNKKNTPKIVAIINPLPSQRS